MVNIYEILLRAASLKEETTLNSISPERAGGIMYDTLLALNDLWLQQGAALVISKIYASVAAMQADTAPVSDLTGQPLRPGQIVVIASSDSDNGSVYRYNGTDAPSWSLVGAIGSIPPVDSLDSDSTTLPLAAHQGKVLDGKISQLGQYVDNPEWVKVVTDSEGKILYGVKTDGKFYFGDGCPPQVVEYVTAKLEELEGDFTTLLNAKVDKVTGKSLIDSEFATSQEVITNPEYLQVITDSEDKILEGIKTNGTKVIELPLEIQGVRQETIDNPEWIQVTTDSEGKILEGITSEGKKKVMVETQMEDVSIDTLNLRILNLSEEGQKKLQEETMEPNIISLSFKKGFIDASTGTVVSDNNKLYTEHYKFNHDIYIGFTKPYIDKPLWNFLVYRVYLYDNGVYNGLLPVQQIDEVSNDQYTRYETIIPANTEFALVLKYSNLSYGSYSFDELISNNGFIGISNKSLYYQVPDYYLSPIVQSGSNVVSNYLNDKIKQIGSLMRSTMGDGDCFIFITDIHFDRNQQHSPALIKYISDRLCIPRMFNGGDDFDGTSLNVNEIYKKAFNGKYYFTIGNHEVESINERPYDYSYPSVISTHWMYNDDVVYGNRYLGYYYINNNNDKIRYIILNAIGKPRYIDGVWSGDDPVAYDTDQMTWFENEALNVEQGWTIIIFSHIVLWRIGQTVDPDEFEIYQAARRMINIVENYSGSGTIAGIFCGDDHLDKMYKTPIKEIPIIMTATDGYPATYDKDNRLPGTIHEHAFDVVVIDKENRKLTMVRIGGLAYNGTTLDSMGDRVEYREITY